MAVKNVWNTDNFRCFQHRTAEQSKAFGIVGIITYRTRVDAVAVKIRSILDKIMVHTGVISACQNRAKAIPVVKRNGDAAYDRLCSVEMGFFITRNKYANAVANRGQCTRQGPDNVGQAPSF